MPIASRSREIALAVLAISTALSVVLAGMTWYWFDWPETAQALMVLTLVNSWIALVALCFCLVVPTRAS